MRAKTGVIKKENQLELKMFYQTHTTRKAAEITPPPAVTEWCHLPLCDVICSEHVPFRRCRGWWEWKHVFCSWWPWPWHSNLSVRGTKHVFCVN